MSQSSYATIARRHTRPTPGWQAAEPAPEQWIDQVVKPLLGELLAPPARIDPDHIALHERPVYGSTAQPRPPTAEEPPYWFVGHIRLAVADPDPASYSRRQSYYAEWPESLECGLYWVGAERWIAIAPRLISRRAYFQSAQRTDLTYPPGPEALRALVQALRERLRELAFNRQKRTKIRNLQLQAIQSQLKRIANEERFDFYVENSPQLIRIGIRLDDINQLLLSVPFTEFEQALPELREMVIHLRALHRRRIRFKTLQSSRYSRWIAPDPPVDSVPTASAPEAS